MSLVSELPDAIATHSIRDSNQEKKRKRKKAFFEGEKLVLGD